MQDELKMVPEMESGIPEELIQLEANGGVYAVWMLLEHCDIQVEISQLIRLCRYDAEDGTFTVQLALALKQLGFEVGFYTLEDLHQHEKERLAFKEAELLNMPVRDTLSYAQIQQAYEQRAFVIVYYDTLEGVGNHSLVYSMDAEEICFFDSFDAMPADVFEQQRYADGICAQVIVAYAPTETRFS